MKILRCLIKNPWVIFLVPSIIIIILDLNFGFINIDEGLLGISLSMCGFIFTAISIILSLSNENSYLLLVKQYGKDKELYKLLITSFIFFMITAILSCINSNEILDKICSYSLIIGITQIVGAVYYIFRICRGYTKKPKN